MYTIIAEYTNYSTREKRTEDATISDSTLLTDKACFLDIVSYLYDLADIDNEAITEIKILGGCF